LRLVGDTEERALMDWLEQNWSDCRQCAEGYNRQYEGFIGQWTHRLPTGRVVICSYMQWEDGVPVGPEDNYASDGE
jgi:hypothetical protein